MNIWVVVLNYNGKDVLEDCLSSLVKVKTKGFKVTSLVYDNGSSDGSVEYIREKFKEVKVLESKDNLGFSEGNNEGIRYALENGAEAVMLLNSDTKVDEGVVETLWMGLGDKKIGIMVPKIYFYPECEFHKDRYEKSDGGKVIWYAGGVIDWDNVYLSHRGVDEVDRGQFDKKKETDFATGCCMMVRKDVFEGVGYLDKKYFLYYEDADFSMRVKKGGFKIVYEPKGVVWHKNAGSIGGSGSDTQDYYLTRNRYLFGFRYGGLKVKLMMVREAVGSIFRGRKAKKEGSVDFLTGRFGKKGK